MAVLDARRAPTVSQVYQEIAEMYEEDVDTTNALTNYQRAADLYLAENAKSSADKCLTKIAMIAGTDANYDLAISTYGGPSA